MNLIPPDLVVQSFNSRHGQVTSDVSAMSHDERHEWFSRAFSSDYRRLYAHRDHREARRQVEDLLNWLAVPAGARCLDLCCGFGRHLDVLLERGLDAVGIDLSQDLLEAAPRELQARLQHGDMRELPWADASFEYVFSFFTSFGYFSTDAENLQVVQEISRVLVSGGVVVFDFLNPPQIRAQLVPEDTFSTGDGLTVTQRRWLDPDHNSVDKELVVVENNECRRYRESVKLYEPADFKRFFAVAGLTLTACCGSTAGAPYSPAADRQIIVGCKEMAADAD